jgi:PleD family two-component response regulator
VLINQLTIPYENNLLAITTSIGLTASYEGIHEFEQMIGVADKNRYQAKVNGRNQTI